MKSKLKLPKKTLKRIKKIKASDLKKNWNRDPYKTKKTVFRKAVING